MHCFVVSGRTSLPAQEVVVWEDILSFLEAQDCLTFIVSVLP